MSLDGKKNVIFSAACPIESINCGPLAGFTCTGSSPVGVQWLARKFREFAS